MSRWLKLSSVIFILVVLLACNMPQNTPTSAVPPDALIQTSAAETIAAIATGVYGTAAPTTGGPTSPPANTPVPPTAEPPTSTFTVPAPPTATFTLPPTVPPPPTAIPVPCDRAKFISDVTVPDNTVFSPNVNFTKTWRLQNDGSCTWNTSYALVFDSGEAMNGPASQALPSSVAPGQTIDLTVSLKAPATAGTYRGNWKLQNAGGARFGIGTSATTAFWVQIVVSVPATPFAVSSVTASAVPAAWVALPCPFTIILNAQITATAAGTISYWWERWEGGAKTGQMPTRSLTFASAGTLPVTEPLVGGFPLYTFNGQYYLYVDNPNHQLFPGPTIIIQCAP